MNKKLIVLGCLLLTACAKPTTSDTGLISTATSSYASAPEFKDSYNLVKFGDTTLELPSNYKSLENLGYSIEVDEDNAIPSGSTGLVRYTKNGTSTAFKGLYMAPAGEEEGHFYTVDESNLVGIVVDADCDPMEKITFYNGLSLLSKEQDAWDCLENISGNHSNITYFKWIDENNGVAIGFTDNKVTSVMAECAGE